MHILFSTSHANAPKISKCFLFESIISLQFIFDIIGENLEKRRYIRTVTLVLIIETSKTKFSENSVVRKRPIRKLKNHRLRSQKTCSCNASAGFTVAGKISILEGHEVKN